MINPNTTVPTVLINGNGLISNSSVTSQYVHSIQGQMYLAEYVVPENLSVMTYQLNEDAIKRKLIEELVTELFLKKAIEFTKAHDASQSKTVYRARIFAVPDTMVRVIRENLK